jgi:hypothetical protein
MINAAAGRNVSDERGLTSHLRYTCRNTHLLGDLRILRRRNLLSLPTNSKCHLNQTLSLSRSSFVFVGYDPCMPLTAS